MTRMEFTTASIEKAAEAIKQHTDAFNSAMADGENLTVEEVAQKMIMDEFGDAQIEAEEIVNDLIKGIKRFDEQFSLNQDSERIKVRQVLLDSANGKSEQERKNCYVNILTAIELLSDSEISQEIINEKIQENSSFSDEELLDRIESELNEKVALSPIITYVKDELNSESLSKVSAILEKNKDGQRLLSALWLYMEQRKGNVKFSDSEFDMPAEQIGVLAAAGVEMLITTNDLNEGKIDQKRWQKVVKWILGAAIGISLAMLALSFVLNMSIIAVSLIWSLFGAGAIATMFALIAGICTAIFTSNWSVNICVSAIELFTEYYDKYIAAFTDKVKGWACKAREWAKAVQEKLKALFHKGNDAGDPSTPGSGNAANAPVVGPIMA